MVKPIIFFTALTEQRDLERWSFLLLLFLFFFHALFMCILNREWYGTEHPVKLTPHVKKFKELLEIELWVCSHYFQWHYFKIRTEEWILKFSYKCIASKAVKMNYICAPLVLPHFFSYKIQIFILNKGILSYK